MTRGSDDHSKQHPPATEHVEAKPPPFLGHAKWIWQKAFTRYWWLALLALLVLILPALKIASLRPSDVVVPMDRGPLSFIISDGHGNNVTVTFPSYSDPHRVASTPTISEIVVDRYNKTAKPDNIKSASPIQEQGLTNTQVATDSQANRRQPIPVTGLDRLSLRAYCGVGNEVIIGGFVVAGDASMTLLLRAVGGETLGASVGQSSALADPVLELHDAVRGNALVATNDNWNRLPEDAAAISAAISKAGVVPFAIKDDTSSALLVTLRPGVYSFIIHAKDNRYGLVQTEIYNVSTSLDEDNRSILQNLAVRTFGGTGQSGVICGFDVVGKSSRKVLVRAVGASTLARQGISSTSAMRDPTIELRRRTGDAENLIATNDNWTDDDHGREIEHSSKRIGATPFLEGDKTSSAIITTLDVGSYSFSVKGNPTVDPDQTNRGANTGPNSGIEHVVGSRQEGSGIVLTEIYQAD